MSKPTLQERLDDLYEHRQGCADPECHICARMREHYNTLSSVLSRLGEVERERNRLRDLVNGPAADMDRFFEPTAEELEMARSGRKIGAIRGYRYRTNTSLIMAKEVIERALATTPKPSEEL